jgi:hypothetical protein
MKIDKRALKSLIKECLIELLAEGLASGNTSLTEGSSTSRLESMLTEKRAQRSPPPPPTRRGNLALEAASKVTNDPVMAKILEDTARTSYARNSQFLVSGENIGDSMSAPVPSVHHNPVAAAVDEHTPEELFGSDIADKWASLAFAPGPHTHTVK